MTKSMELANQLKDLYFKRNKENTLLSGVLKKINFFAVYNVDDATPMIVAVDILLPGETEPTSVTALCYSTVENTSPQVYASMLSDYASGDFNNYKFIMNLSKVNSEDNNYFIESIVIQS